MSPPRPGLTYINRIVYKNLGLTATSGTITFTKPTPVAIINVSQAGSVTTATGFTYAFTNLLPNETRFFNVTMSVPSSPTVVLNQLLTANASITAPANDINVTNNSSSLTQIVVNSYDPNDKMEAHGDEIPFIAKNQLALTADLEHKKYSLALNARYIGEFRTKAGQGDIPEKRVNLCRR